jgi:2-oxoglutarate ferredoxin oxidoreductase subunit alpha
MMEGVVLPPPLEGCKRPDRPWAVGSGKSGARNRISSCILDPETLEAAIHSRYERYEAIAKERTSFEEIEVGDAELVFVAYGTSARVCLGAVQAARKAGLKLGLFRPITLWPFPSERLASIASDGKRFLAVEMSMGQMVQDVRLAVNGAAQVDFFGRCGGVVPSEEEVLAVAKKLLGRDA